MLKEKLDGLSVSISDETIIEDFTFVGDNIIATIGSANGAVCGPILNLQINNSSSLTIKGEGFEINWENIEITDDQINVIRNGKPAIYVIK